MASGTPFGFGSLGGILAGMIGFGLNFGRDLGSGVDTTLGWRVDT